MYNCVIPYIIYVLLSLFSICYLIIISLSHFIGCRISCNTVHVNVFVKDTDASRIY